jgi:hypothetical protein
MADQRAAKIHTAFDVNAKLRLEVLRQQLRENGLLGEILRSDDKPGVAGSSAGSQEERRYKEEIRRLFHRFP